MKKVENRFINGMKSRRLLVITGMIILTLLFSLTLLTEKASALGITPGRTTINYEHNLEKEVTFQILNNEHKEMQVYVSVVQGELNEAITLSSQMISFTPEEDSKSFTYKVQLPEALANAPGLHVVEIMALETPKESEDGTFVGATIAVISQLYIYVPCPGKCIDAELNVLNAEQNSSLTFIVPVINRGKLGIGEVHAVIDIYSLAGEKLATVQTDSASIESGARVELIGSWLANVASGNYLAKVTVTYDGETKNFDKEFNIGSQNLNIESISVNDFQLGEIAKLRILVENRWNQEIKEVYANLLVYNSEEQVMADVKSAREDIDSLSKKELVAYWDTVGVKEGEYSGKLIIKYGEKSSDKNLLLKVSEYSLDITGVGYSVLSKTGGSINIVTILVVLVILLLIVNLAWFVFFNRKKNKAN